MICGQRKQNIFAKGAGPTKSRCNDWINSLSHDVTVGDERTVIRRRLRTWRTRSSPSDRVEYRARDGAYSLPSAGGNTDANANVRAHGDAALGAGLRLRRGGRLYGARRSCRSGAHRRAGDRGGRQLFRHRGAIWRWPIREEPWPVFQNLKPANVVVGTKVRLPPNDFGRIADAITKSLEGSLARLRLERVDILHLHNSITAEGGGPALSVRQVLEEVVPAFERLRDRAKSVSSG